MSTAVKYSTHVPIACNMKTFWIHARWAVTMDEN